jgi:hypothetical protein
VDEANGRNVTMEGCGALRDCRYLLHDRDTKYTQSFRAIIASGRVEDIIRGEKGAGKSAIYSLLMTRSGDFFDRGAQAPTDTGLWPL